MEKKVIITGGSKGIGLACAKVFLMEVQVLRSYHGVMKILPMRRIHWTSLERFIPFAST